MENVMELNTIIITSDKIETDVIEKKELKEFFDILVPQNIKIINLGNIIRLSNIEKEKEKISIFVPKGHTLDIR